MSAFVFVSAVGSIIFGLANSVEMLTVGRLLVGFGCGFVYIPAMRIMSDWYKPDELGTYSGAIVAAGNVGAMISAAPLVLLMNLIGWRNSFHAVGVVTILAAILAYVIVRDRPSELGFPTPRELMGLAPAAPGPKVRMGDALKIVFSSGKFYLLSTLMFCFYGTLMGIGSLWAGPYLQNAFGLSKQVSSNIIMMFPLGMAFGCPISGYLSDKILKSRKKILLYGVILHALSYIPLIAFIGDLSTFSLYVVFFLYGLTGGTFVNCFVCVKEAFDIRYAGTAMGALNVFVFAGSAFFQNIIGIVLGMYPVVSAGVYPVEAYVAALSRCLVGLIAGTLVFLFYKETKK
jgi:sugar phosphate permease